MTNVNIYTTVRIRSAPKRCPAHHPDRAVVIGRLQIIENNLKTQSYEIAITARINCAPKRCLVHHPNRAVVIGSLQIVEKRNINKIKKYFTKPFQPYEIGSVTKGLKRVNLDNKIKW